MMRTVQKSIWGAFTLLFSATSLAQSANPWFEIELLAFKRAGSIPMAEKFSGEVKEIHNLQAMDLLSQQAIADLRPALLAVTPCEPKKLTEFTSLDPFADYRQPYDFPAELSAEAPVEDVAATSFQETAETQFLPENNLCQQFPYIRSHYALDMMALDTEDLLQSSAPLRLATTPKGSEEHQNRPYLAPETALKLQDLAYQLRQRGGHDVILHMAWREALKSRNQAPWQRIFAGQRFSPMFDYQGRQQKLQGSSTQFSQQNIDEQIEQRYQAIKQNQPLPMLGATNSDIQQVSKLIWQLDGQVRLYNERMLFIDTEFNFRQLSADGQQLNTFYSKDNSRLLLENIHYLDHPFFGIVVQIRRFTPPMQAETPLAITNN